MTHNKDAAREHIEKIVILVVLLSVAPAGVAWVRSRLKKKDEVMEPVLHGDSADYVAALSRYFGGAPRTSAREREGEPTPPRVKPIATTGEAGETPRRGC